ncbi:DUF7410 domain-containing protein [Haloprofundus halobius]|uniref:DUF7410 domain-containing protein n=1 Tax=Haloprofundus halobius TaxID=2876194 RepID=UPI001CCFDD12|nr:hypothetical protein [Haloprofundus halobius]
MSEPLVPETFVPPGEKPVAVCPYCERPFKTERRCTLHVGEVHPDSDGAHVSATSRDDPILRERYEAASEAEAEELFLFHLKVFVALGAVYAAFIVLAIVAFSLAG